MSIQDALVTIKDLREDNARLEARVKELEKSARLETEREAAREEATTWRDRKYEAQGHANRLEKELAEARAEIVVLEREVAADALELAAERRFSMKGAAATEACFIELERQLAEAREKCVAIDADFRSQLAASSEQVKRLESLLPVIKQDEDGAIWFQLGDAAFNLMASGPITKKNLLAYKARLEALSTPKEKA